MWYNININEKGVILLPYKSLIVDKTDIKIYILYIFRLLNNLGQDVTFELLSEVVSWEGAVNYFDFTEGFSFLLENGSICENLEKGKDVYDISNKGMMIIDTMEKSLVANVRDSALRSIMRYFSFKKDASLYKNEIVEEGNGWRIRCFLKSGDKVVAEANVYSENRAYIDKISLNFEQNAEKIIDGIIGFMTGDIDFFFNDKN